MIAIHQPDPGLGERELVAGPGKGRRNAGCTFEPSRVFLAAALLLAWAAGAAAQTATESIPNAPGQSQPAQGQFAGSVASEPVPGVVRLSLQDAIDRGLKQNLGALLSSADIRFSRGQRWQQLSALLPHV